MMSPKFLLLILLLLPLGVVGQSTRLLTISSEPNALVWIDDVLYGKTGSDGTITFRTFAVGTHKLRVRALGFKEVTQNLLPSQKGRIRIPLTKTTDEAEIAFQKAELEPEREPSVELYRKAVKLRPNYPEAYIGMARQLANMGETDEALAAVRTARRYRPGFSWASAVEGRIYKESGEIEKAVAAFKRAIAEGRGVQPEAHTGLGLIYKERAESFASEGDSDNEIANYLLAAGELRKAVVQLSGSPDALTIYQLLGDAYERAEKWQEAIKVYTEALATFPDANEAEMFRSFIVQAKKRLEEER